ncbi:unnamed protein product [Rotaria sp. Silwood2]|nr:unnamed protein product [Rotaria sp. Silwood2]CAF3047582.1 unnamed protein product [Rotaria sp. Silwood2]CAF3254556.1 unnamed protein product [Rotaria sp. Silwood2]CAF3992140.1 unnamed protein product [Rotaria sp. Silwood2]CAF4094288.1 unnamed protein product [Rotaria sp. Silwood2]
MQLLALALVVLAVVSANAFTQAQIKFQDETLQHHNKLRTRNCVSPLQLDNNLSLTAQNYAEYLASRNLFQHSNNGYGENLYMMSGSAPLGSLHGNAATQSWYDEINMYNFNQPGFSMQTGHFTQVVWKSSQKLGVGIAFGNGGRTAVVVTNYYPPGNYMGEFQQNVMRAQC